MAVTLTEAEKLDIVKVFAEVSEWTYIDINDKITNLGESYVTAAVETDIRAILVEWETIKNDFAKFTATDSNEGFNLDLEARKNRARQELAKLLYLDLGNSGGRSWGYSRRA